MSYLLALDLLPTAGEPQIEELVSKQVVTQATRTAVIKISSKWVYKHFQINFKLIYFSDFILKISS